MKTRIIFLSLLLTIFLSACSQSQELSEEERLQKEREYLENQSQEFLEKKRQEESPELVPPQGSSNEEFNEEEFTEIPEESGAEESSEEEPEANTDETPPSIDINLVDVDLDFPDPFDLEEDGVDVEVRIETEGIPQGEGFLVEALARNDEGDEVTCQFIYIVGGREDECELDNFQEFGEYTIDVFADLRDRYKEENEKNNVFLDKFRLDEN